MLIETESLLEVQQKTGYKAEKGDVLVRKRKIVLGRGMIGKISINLPSTVGIYGATQDEIDQQVDELREVYGQELAATGAVCGSPMADRMGPMLTIYSDTSDEEVGQIRDLVGYDIAIMKLQSSSPEARR